MDPYAILGVAHDADKAAIQTAFRRRARILHPDRHADGPDSADAAEMFQQLKDARDVALRNLATPPPPERTDTRAPSQPQPPHRDTTGPTPPRPGGVVSPLPEDIKRMLPFGVGRIGRAVSAVTGTVFIAFGLLFASLALEAGGNLFVWLFAGLTFSTGVKLWHGLVATRPLSR